jgi:hypothetical protein
MANMAVEILIQRIQAIDQGCEGAVFTPQNIKLLPQLVIRSSTGGSI